MLTELLSTKIQKGINDAAGEVKNRINEALILVQTPGSHLTKVRAELNAALETMGIACIHMADDEIRETLSTRVRVINEKFILLRKGDANALFTKIEEQLRELKLYLRGEHPTQIADLGQ